MSSEAEQNKALVRRLFEARGKPDMDAVEKMASPLPQPHWCFPASNSTGKVSKRMTLEYHAAFSSTRFIVEAGSRSRRW